MSLHSNNPRNVLLKPVSDERATTELRAIEAPKIDTGRLTMLERQINNGNLKVRRERTPTLKIARAGAILKSGIKSE